MKKENGIYAIKHFVNIAFSKHKKKRNNMGGKPSKATKADMRLKENKQAAQANATANKSIIARRGKPL